ncbi:MAG: hypothetical protein MI922_27590 [Bacteroidales bacterium]|nr:hypothetical protein [Bacteroidales bacterium]
MTKYTFLVYHKEYQEFLKGIQSLGVVHVVEKESGTIEDEELQSLHKELASVNDSIKFLSKRNVEYVKAKDERTGEDIIKEIETLKEKQEEYQQKIQSAKKDWNLLAPWGEFDWNLVDKLEEEGVEIEFFSCQSRTFKQEWLDEYNLEIISEEGGNINFIIICKEGDSIRIDADEVKLPEESLSDINKEIKSLENTNEKTEDIYDDLASKYIPVLEKLRNELLQKLSFNNVVLNTHSEVEDNVLILEGWVPGDKEESLTSYLSKTGVYFENDAPTPGDNVPIQLKNNRFARLYESIGELYTLPDYKEIDLTPFFAPFFMLFFGFCLGDAGYGLLILVATVIGWFKVKPKLKPVMSLGIFLGLATVIMGVVSGTFFGIMLLDTDWPWLENFKKVMLDDKKLMLLSIGLGYIQVLFGMFLKAANKVRMYGFKHAISQFGWIIIVLITIPAFGLASQEMIDTNLGMRIALISLIVGGVPALFYNSPGKNIFLNFGLGIWDTYGMASGLLGDLLSYIRLFALGISSAVLGSVFNQLAMDLSPDTIIVKQIVMVLILAFGHSLNLFMAALGSFVHPLRLTFVEFYKNAGFNGGGSKYEPFRK